MNEQNIDPPRRGRPPMQRPAPSDPMYNQGKGATVTTEFRAEAPNTTPIYDGEKFEGADPGPRKFVRKPFGAMTLKLAYPEREGFHRHWFNETTGRIQRAQEAGYEHVVAEGKPVQKVVGTAEGGGALNAFLMEIPQEWFDEDMAAQQREIDDKEKAIKRGEADGQDGDNRYVPSQGISIKRS